MLSSKPYFRLHLTPLFISHFRSFLFLSCNSLYLLLFFLALKFPPISVSTIYYHPLSSPSTVSTSPLFLLYIPPSHTLLPFSTFLFLQDLTLSLSHHPTIYFSTNNILFPLPFPFFVFAICVFHLNPFSNLPCHIHIQIIQKLSLLANPATF